MKQVIQSINNGEMRVADVPAPGLMPRGVLVRTGASLVSAGTERMVVDFAEKNLLDKARSRPDLVRQTLDKVQREGLVTTVEAVRNRLDQPMALGYSSAGTVLDVGAQVPGIQIGDRVACAGGGYAVHAEIVAVPRNLVVKLPPNVDFESAAFTTIGAIALQGIRLAEVKLGEVVAVIGLGLLGQLAVQLLNASGCVVIGMDIQPQRAELAKSLGAHAVAASRDELLSLAQRYSNGHGVDVVLITADTKSNEPIEVAGEITRSKGTVVAVGAVGLNIPRKPYYEKEIDLRISRSYGPGRYDTEYEEQGQDYPYAYVRWTEQRNMEAFVQMLGEGKVDVRPLISHSFAIEEASKAYDLILGKTGAPFLGVVLTYPHEAEIERTVTLRNVPVSAMGVRRVDQVRLGVLGAGNFANATLLPALKDIQKLSLVGIASGGGLSARATAERFKFAFCSTDTQALIDNPAINTVAILTRHHLHARQIIAALDAGKHVFVEKPLCVNEEELQTIVAAVAQASERASNDGKAPSVMVGFNRRFAPFVRELKQHLSQINEPMMVQYRVNAGYIPLEHWVHDPAQGGGRLIGEGCHFIDLVNFLVGKPLRQVRTRALPDNGRYAQDNLSIDLEYEDGSLGSIVYVANGDKGFGKEALEVFGGGLAARLDDYRSLQIRHGHTRINRVARLRQDKGHRGEWQRLVGYLTGGGPQPIPFAEIIHSMRATFAAQRSLTYGEPVRLSEGE